MRHYPRAWNRILAFFTGLLMLVIGVGLALTQLWPAFNTQWEKYGTQGLDLLKEGLDHSRIPGSELSWIHVGVFALLIIAIIVSLATIFGQSGGKTKHTLSFSSPALDGSGGTSGSTTLTTKFIEQYVQDKLQSEPTINSVNVSSWMVKRKNGLLLRVRLNTGASPAAAYRRIDMLTKDLDRLLGQSIPLMVRLSQGGTIAKSFQSAPRVS
ncbi:hypothetical protein BSR29_07455 [Boudabousia liubingyangii]|uniref:Uncharacterized protein n=1 Tax=Boudabousia liubingyangii TaxID=1921764 RepID=A0A1Q5PK86_9ACTO|nr:hypothetical protein [Boudabousia liubingyangii]OKL46644.1 hypothetical protein BSR29_07455 [Boudabousia liubingyangii]